MNNKQSIKTRITENRWKSNFQYLPGYIRSTVEPELIYRGTTNAIHRAGNVYMRESDSGRLAKIPGRINILDSPGLTYFKLKFWFGCNFYNQRITVQYRTTYTKVLIYWNWSGSHRFFNRSYSWQYLNYFGSDDPTKFWIIYSRFRIYAIIRLILTFSFLVSLLWGALFKPLNTWILISQVVYKKSVFRFTHNQKLKISRVENN